MRLSKLAPQVPAVVRAVESHAGFDFIANRLNELGFVAGETVRLISRAPFGGDPILVQVGFTRFALRLAEAERVVVDEVTL